MFIKIISGTYGHRPLLPDGTRSHSLTTVRPGDPPIEVCKSDGERLIGLRVAVEIKPEEIKGQTVEAPGTPAEPEEMHGIPLEEMSFADLKALAQEMGIKTGNIRSKAGLIEAISQQTPEGVPADDLPDLSAQDVVDE